MIKEGTRIEDVDPSLIQAARKEDMDYMNQIQMFEYVSQEECDRQAQRRPTSTRWVDVVKRDDAGKLVVRSRLVGRDFKVKGERDREDLFAAMPPLEAKKLLFRMAASMNKSRAGRGLPELKLMFIDVRKARLNSVCDEVEFVFLPSEFEEFGVVAKLRRWLYGMRPAGKAWEEHYAQRLREAGFTRGVAAPTLFHCQGSGVRVVVHGDDFTFLGSQAELIKIKEAMSSWYDIKSVELWEAMLRTSRR